MHDSVRVNKKEDAGRKHSSIALSITCALFLLLLLLLLVLLIKPLMNTKNTFFDHEKLAAYRRSIQLWIVSSI